MIFDPSFRPPRGVRRLLDILIEGVAAAGLGVLIVLALLPPAVLSTPLLLSFTTSAASLA